MLWWSEVNYQGFVWRIGLNLKAKIRRSDFYLDEMVLNFEARAANLAITKQNKNLIELGRSVFRLDEAKFDF